MGSRLGSNTSTFFRNKFSRDIIELIWNLMIGEVKFGFCLFGVVLPPPSFLINDATCLDKCIPIILLLKLNAQQTCSILYAADTCT